MTRTPTTTLAFSKSDAANLSDPLGSSNANAWSDWLGMTASIGCAIHCAAMPFVIAYLPALGLSFLADEAFHKWMAVGCFLIAVAAFIPGLRKHGRLSPVVVAGVGLVMISVAAFGFAGECCPSCDSGHSANASTSPESCSDADCPLCSVDSPATKASSLQVSQEGSAAIASVSSSWLTSIVPWLTPVGGLILVSAHLLNRRYGCLCGCCDSGSSEEVVE